MRHTRRLGFAARLRALWITAAIALVISCAASGSLAAATAAMPGLPNLITGIADDRSFVQAADPARSTWLARAQAIGSTTIRVAVDWADVAPSQPGPLFRASNPADPSYDFASIDAAVRAAVAHRQQVVLMLYHAPSWAEGTNPPATAFPGSWLPSPTAFAAFARAVALRYSGAFPDPLQFGRSLPRVVYFQAWNEANLPRYLSPQWAYDSHHRIVPFAPGWYRTMLNAFYTAVKRVHDNDVVLEGGTAPYGDPPATGQQRMAPVVFLRELFCLTPSLRAKSCSGPPPHLDVLDHHPYSSAPQVRARNAGDIGVPDLGKIWRILGAAQRARHVVPASAKALWVTELDWATNPPTPANLAVQQRYLDLGFYELWRQRVARVFWFYISDQPGQPNSFTGGGLYLTSGVAKPAAGAYRFPFLAVPASGGRMTVWGRAPGIGTVVIEQLAGRRWRRLFMLGTTRGGIFYAQRPLAHHTQTRAVFGRLESPVWTTN